MLRLNYFVAAQEFVIDQAKGRWTAVTCLEEFWPNKFPCVISKLALVASFIWDSSAPASESELLWKISRPGASSPETFTTRFVPQEKHNNIFRQFFGIPLEASGIMRCGVSLDGVEVGALEITVWDAIADEVDKSLIHGLTIAVSDVPASPAIPDAT